jgi:hypothetical protein
MRWLRAMLFALLLPACSAIAAEPQPLDHWLAYNGGPLPPTWSIAGGVLRHTPGGGDIRTADQYRDFALDFDWQVTPGGNSGVFYRVPAGRQAFAYDAPEYQILDNAGHPDGKKAITSAASAYDVEAPGADLTRPVGQWNSARIVVVGRHVEHWLNGTRVLQYDIGSPDWTAQVARSKFRGGDYGQAPQGYIVLQDHGAAVAYRNFRLTPLP